MSDPGQANSKKSKIGLLGIVITAIVAFIFGIGSNQVTDFVKRADDCLDGLSQYLVGVESDITAKSDALVIISNGTVVVEQSVKTKRTVITAGRITLERSAAIGRVGLLGDGGADR